MIEVPLMEAATRALVTLDNDSPRVSRALRHYELALRNWHVGGEWLALAHLWIAAENLTKAVVRDISRSRGVTEEDLAHEYDLVTDDPARPRWKDLLGARVRADVIFAGDGATYKAASGASNGMEHGIWELDRVAAEALKSADKTFEYIRRTIIHLLKLPDDIRDALMKHGPKDVQSRRKVIRGALLGFAQDPAMEGELYPRVEWHSSINSVDRTDRVFKLSEIERMTVRTHPDVGFRLDGIEFRGRLENGETTVQLSDEDVSVDTWSTSSSEALLRSVMPLVNQTMEQGTRLGRSGAVAFKMCGQAAAYFHAIEVLITAGQPVEALLPLRALTMMAGRFEQMTDPSGPGLGVAIATELESLDALGADVDLTSGKREAIMQLADAEGVTVPPLLQDVTSTSIYRSLTAEMGLAAEGSAGLYLSATLHSTASSDGEVTFELTQPPGPFTDMVATAAVIAMLELLRHAAELFGWSGPPGEVDDVLGRARALNESSAAG